MNKPAETILAAILKKAPVVPVIVIEKLADAVPLARALVKGGLPVLEITLRTEAALEAISAITAEVEGAVTGAGTVLTARQLEAVAKRRAAFAVSPGSTPDLLAAAGRTVAVPLLPGAATPSESMALSDKGFAIQKFFPAEPAGGAAYLASLASPLQHLLFCPTGGITPAKAPDYLALPNVIAIGGSWMLPKALVARGDWAGIEKLAREAASLRAAC